MVLGERVAVITGAASGIGYALTRVCLEQGIKVVMADNAENLDEKATLLKTQIKTAEILAVHCDVTQPGNLTNLAEQTIQSFGLVTWLFNNAGISGPLAPIWELNNEQIQQVIDVNVFGIIYGIKAFLPIMFEQKHRSRIINMASCYALCSGSQMAAYAMSKHAIIALSESLYFDLQRLNKPVDVSVICPSFANTSLLANSAPATDNLFHKKMSGLLALGRPVEDLATHVLREIEKNSFYILPDKEVKDYCAQRTKAIVEQTAPYRHNLEQLVASLSRRL